MAIKKKNGFALVIAVIFMSVMLSFGLALGSLSYKQQVLASSAVQSQYAFYAADAGLECALHADQQQDLFNYSAHDEDNPPSSITCDGMSAETRLVYLYNEDQLVLKERLSLDNGNRCVDITVYKPNPFGAGINYIFSQGYDVSCNTVQNPNEARFVARGISIHY